MNNLHKLYANGNCGIDDKGIEKLYLNELNNIKYFKIKNFKEIYKNEYVDSGGFRNFKKLIMN